MGAIEVKGLRKSFKSQTVLDAVDLSVESGEIFALLGSNGVGKTTTIKILSTLLRADGGSADVCGFDVARQGRRVRESISLTGQFAATDDILTGRENLVMIAKLRHLDDPKGEAARLLDSFGLRDAADKPLSTYSGGMKRRLDLAMGMVGSPRVVFLDEPTTGLDPQGRLAVWHTIRAMGQSGVTVLLTTQYLEEADSLAGRIAILHGGRVAAEGTAAELKRLAPPPKLALSFLEEGDMARASEVLAAYEPEPEALTLTVTTDGSVSQTTEILRRLEEAGVTATFAQRPPTLEEAFLTIIGERASWTYDTH
jgi:ABC-2 type transport system ATP-binding protein